MTFKEFMTKCGAVRHRPKIVCMDGFKMSVQGNEMTYSIPKKVATEFTAMEIGFPSAQEDLIMEFIDRLVLEPTQSVYGYIPIDLIEKIVEKHGGIDESVTFQDF
jgi:hypothetical protein